MYFYSELLKYIKKNYHIKKGMEITYELIKKISINEQINLKDLACLFQISYTTWSNLKNEKQSAMKLKFNQYMTIKSKSIAKLEVISYDEFLELKLKMNLKESPLKRILGITNYKYYQLKNEMVSKIRIRNMKLKHTVDLIKIDLKYLSQYGERYYTKAELEKICKKRYISLNSFLKYYSSNPKHYKFNKMVIERNEKGFWIGEKIQVSNEFINENYEHIKLRIKKTFYKVSNMMGYVTWGEDIVQDTIGVLYEKCGNIEKNFEFDTKLMYNILMVKAKYFMINFCKKEYKENENLHYDGFESVERIGFLSYNDK